MERLEDFKDSKKIYTVTELTRNIKSVLMDNFFDIWVRGEISNYRMASSGHIYFSIKDENALLKAVLFRGYQNNIRFNLEDGIKVIVHGNLDLFEKRGEYQIIVDTVEPEGIGALQLAFEQLKEKLKKEGLFDNRYKKPIPPFPETIGIITSDKGAALRDILNVTGRRYSGLRIIIYPTLVQGEGAAESIVEAIKKANERNEVDVIILGRGGGSIEDLWPFNEEIVARAIFESKIPIISAVGHEIDFTISDFVADLRAPTPSAAAELVVKNKEDLIKWLRDTYIRLNSSIDRHINLRRERLSRFSVEQITRLMESIINQKAMQVDELSRSMQRLIELIISHSRGKFERLVGTLNALSPLKTISRGFAVVEKLPEYKPIFSIKSLSENDEVKTILKDGSFTGIVQKIYRETPDFYKK